MIKALLLSLLISGAVEAKVKTEKIEYKSGDLTFEGVLAYDTNNKGNKPGIMVVHNWMGVSAETESKITEMAKLGYVVLPVIFMVKVFALKTQKKQGSWQGNIRETLNFFAKEQTWRLKH